MAGKCRPFLANLSTYMCHLRCRDFNFGMRSLVNQNGRQHVWCKG